MTHKKDKFLLGGLDLTPELVELWSELPGVMFAIKDASGRYVEVNQAFVRRSSAASRAGAIGRTAAELFLPMLAQRYEAQDREVMSSGKPLRGELEVIRAPGGQPAWYLTTKLPVMRRPGNGSEADFGAVGVVTISTALVAFGSSDQMGEPLTRVVAMVRAALSDGWSHLPTVTELASAAGMSVATLERNMRKVFGLTPKAYVLQQRVNKAIKLLTETDLPISQVAVRAGFYDQPSLTRQLVRLTGETPGNWRRGKR
jgi:AraC-like DNA-binding protein